MGTWYGWQMALSRHQQLERIIRVAYESLCSAMVGMAASCRRLLAAAANRQFVHLQRPLIAQHETSMDSADRPNRRNDCFCRDCDSTFHQMGMALLTYNLRGHFMPAAALSWHQFGGPIFFLNQLSNASRSASSTVIPLTRAICSKRFISSASIVSVVSSSIFCSLALRF
jgi:hypothetical protein